MTCSGVTASQNTGVRSDTDASSGRNTPATTNHIPPLGQGATMQERVASLSERCVLAVDDRRRNCIPSSNRSARAKRIILFLASCSVAATLAGCGGGGSKTDFTLEVAPATVTVVPGGAAQILTVGATPVNGFKGSVAVTVGSLPTGVTASPTTLSLTPGTFGQVSITASAAASAGAASISVTGTSGALTHSGSSALTVGTPPPAPDFSLEVAPATVTLIPGGAAQTLTVAATPT